MRLLSICVLAAVTFGVGRALLSASMTNGQAFAELSDYNECYSFTRGQIDWVPAATNKCSGGKSCDFPKEICMEDIMSFFDVEPVLECKKVPAECYEKASAVPITVTTTTTPTAATTTTTKPALQCGAGELKLGRGNGCERYCGDMTRTACYLDEAGCACRPGYVRKTAEKDAPCIRKSLCPLPVVTTTTTTAKPEVEDALPEECAESKSIGSACVVDGRRMNRWTQRYHWTGSTCQVFLYRGCGGSRNNFVTEADCLEKCNLTPSTTTTTPLGPSPACLLPKAAGTYCGQRWRPLYYWNGTMCRRFFYTGCDGNANNFKDRAECERNCKV